MVLTSLTIILVFIIGIRYGQHVEKQNKKVETIKTPLPSPTQKPKELRLSFIPYFHKQCGLSFLYPSTLDLSKETSTSAQFKQDNVLKMAFSCNTINPFITNMKEDKMATDVAKFNVVTGKRNYFYISKELLPLLESSIKFTLTKN